MSATVNSASHVRRAEDVVDLTGLESDEDEYTTAAYNTDHTAARPMTAALRQQHQHRTDYQTPLHSLLPGTARPLLRPSTAAAGPFPSASHSLSSTLTRSVAPFSLSTDASSALFADPAALYLSGSPPRPSAKLHHTAAVSPLLPDTARPSAFVNGAYPTGGVPHMTAVTHSHSQHQHQQQQQQQSHVTYAHIHSPSLPAAHSHLHRHPSASAQPLGTAPAVMLANMATNMASKTASYVSSWMTATSSSTTALADASAANAATASATATATTTTTTTTTATTTTTTTTAVAAQTVHPPLRPAPSSRSPGALVPFVPAVVATAASVAPGASAFFPSPPEGYFPEMGDSTMAAFKAAKALHKRQVRHSRPTDSEGVLEATTATTAHRGTSSTTMVASSHSSFLSQSASSAFVSYSANLQHRSALQQPAARHRMQLVEVVEGESSGMSDPSEDASIRSESGESLFYLSPDDNHGGLNNYVDDDERLNDDSDVDRGGRRMEKEEQVMYISDSDSDAAYRNSRRRARSRRSASLSPSRSPSYSRSRSHLYSRSPSQSPSHSPPPPSRPAHPLSSYRTCMTCLHRLSKLHFNKDQWALAKEYSQCKDCESAAEGRRRKRRKDRKRRERQGRRPHTALEDTEEGAGGNIDGQTKGRRGVTRAAWLMSRLERLYKEEEEDEDGMEQEDMIVDAEGLREAAHRKDRVAAVIATEGRVGERQPPSSRPQLKRSGQQSTAHVRRGRSAAPEVDDGAQTEVEDVSQRHRAAGERRKRRRRRDSDGDKSAKKKRKLLAPEINPYNRNFTAQQAITNSRSGRLGASAATNTPPPPPLQPNVITFLRTAFGLDGVDHKTSTQVNTVFAKYMEQTGTLGSGKVFVAVSSVNTLDGSVNTDDEGAASVRRTRQRQKQEIAQKGKSGGDQWQPMLGLFAGRDIEKDEVVTTYGGVLVDGDDARRRHASTYTHIRRIRDSRMVRDGRLFSALFDRSQVDMYDQFTLDKKRKSRKHLLPACGAEHVITALSMEGHEDEMRVGLILLDALQGEKGALHGQRMEMKEQQQLLASIMAHIGEQSTVISGEALKQIDGKRFLSRVRGPALIINEPSATFYSSSPNPYSSRSGDHTTTEGEQVFRDKSLDISYLFPFPIRPSLLPPLQLHPLPEQRHKALRELTQNLSETARQLLAATCGKVHELLHTTGMGFMANTGSKRECNVRVIEVNPRRDGLAPNEIFYVSCRKILRGEEILAPYNNNESKSKRMARVKGKQKAEEDDDDEGADGQDGEQEEKGEKQTRAKEETKADDEERYAGLTGTQKARMKRREAVERKQKKRELLRLRALQRSARLKRGKTPDTAEAAEEEEDEEEEEEDLEAVDHHNGDAEPMDGKKQTRRSITEVAAERAANGAEECDSPAPEVVDLSSPASSSPSLSPSCSASPSPVPISSSPALSFSPIPPPSPSPAAAEKSAAPAAAELGHGQRTSLPSAPLRSASREIDTQTVARAKPEQQVQEDAESERCLERARERKRRERVDPSKECGRVKRAAAAPVEVIDVDAEEDEDAVEEDEGLRSDQEVVRKGFSILRRQDSPWMPPVIYEQRTRARSAFGGELRQPSNVGIEVSHQQMARMAAEAAGRTRPQ